MAHRKTFKPKHRGQRVLSHNPQPVPLEYTHFLYIPWTGLGLYRGFRGNRWLSNRIKVFKQFVVPSLINQTSENFILWCSFRPEERNNKHVKELKNYLDTVGIKNVFTYGGVCFWDDKYPDEVARTRLVEAIHYSMLDLINHVTTDHVIMTIQPSDDCYMDQMVEGVQKFFDRFPQHQAITFTKGYIMNYTNGSVSEYNPATNPPFFSIKFPKAVFIDPMRHVEYTGPYKSHEYVGDKLILGKFEDRGFLVGTHGENISTYYDHPYKGAEFLGEKKEEVLKKFGLDGVAPIKIRKGLRRWIMYQLPHKVRRKLRYWISERFYSKIYEYIR